MSNSTSPNESTTKPSTLADTRPRAVFPEQAAPMLLMSAHRVRDLCKSGGIRCIRNGRRFIIPMSAIDEFLDGRR